MFPVAVNILYVKEPKACICSLSNQCCLQVSSTLCWSTDFTSWNSQRQLRLWGSWGTGRTRVSWMPKNCRIALPVGWNPWKILESQGWISFWMSRAVWSLFKYSVVSVKLRGQEPPYARWGQSNKQCLHLLSHLDFSGLFCKRPSGCYQYNLRSLQDLDTRGRTEASPMVWCPLMWLRFFLSKRTSVLGTPCSFSSILGITASLSAKNSPAKHWRYKDFEK